jgi:ArsR family transcriptional regulator
MDRQLATMERVFQALADKTRLRILGLLLTGEVCVCHIHESLAVSQPKASRHLAYLRRAGIVQTRRQGLWVYYRLAENHDELIVRRDAARLQKKTGCCLPVSTPLAGLTCCGDAVGPASANPPM